MKKILIGLFVVLIIATSIIIVFQWSKKPTLEKKTITSDNSVSEPLQFCVFGYLPVSSEKALEVLKKKYPSFDPDTLYIDGYPFKYTEVCEDLGLKYPGYLRIKKDGIVYNEMDSLKATVKFHGENTFQFVEDNRTNPEVSPVMSNLFLININKDFTLRHRVVLNKIHSFSEPSLESNVISDAVAYLQTNLKKEELHFVSEKEDYIDLKQEILNNYKLKLYQIGDYSTQEFFIATFDPNKKESPFGTFSFFFVNQKIEKFGFFDSYVSFSIDNQWYLGFYDQVYLYSGAWGKVLCTMQNKKLKELVADDSFSN